MSSPEIRILDDAVAVVRRRPSMYLKAGVTAVNLAEALAHDARLLGARQVTVERHDDWTIVGADIDWLRERGAHPHDLAPADLFRRIVPFPEDGANSMRHEVLATAFATEVASSTPSDRLVVNGNISDDDRIWVLLRRGGYERSIGFRGVHAYEQSGGG